MSECVVEVGPATVRGPCPGTSDVVTAALDFIDDDIAILDDAPVTVDALWRRVFRDVLPDSQDTAVLICPTWWSEARVERVRAAAAARAADVAVMQRGAVFGGARGNPTVVEIAPDLVITARAGAVVAADPRQGATADVARSVAARIGPSTSVLVDAPAGVAGGPELAAAIAERLRTDGAAVTIAPQDRVLRFRPTPSSSAHTVEEPQRPRPGRAVALVILMVSVTLFGVGTALGAGRHEPEPIPMTLLVEGRVAVKVPALWHVERVTVGPGSARLQAVSPDKAVAVLVTQSQVRRGETLASTSATLRRAFDGQPSGVFSRFDPDDRRANRPAVTYRELRGLRQTDWAVFVDGGVRIAVGCQAGLGAEDAVASVCDEAIRSAHAII